ncbi:gas vesicle protein [Teichococcus aestuarii]|uniref:gas vesicle protein n=1 Tax=Teichococcus aestuarii TaxID=568898 RepID=UPI00360DC733
MSHSATLERPPALPQQQSLVEVLDRLLETGVVLDGQLVLSVAGVDLVQISLRALLSSVEAASRMMMGPPTP